MTFFKFNMLLSKGLFLILLIISGCSTFQSVQNKEQAQLTGRFPAEVNVCRIYDRGPVEKNRGSKGQQSTAEYLRARMQKTSEVRVWSAWQQKLAREVSNSHHAQTLLELGFEMKSVDDHQIMAPPENLLVPLEMYNRRVLKMIKDGQLKESEAIFATLLFDSVKRKTRKIKTFRPGIDELPNAHRYDLSDVGIEIFHHKWASFIGNGHMPVNFGEVYMHDLAHLTDNLRIDSRTQRPEFMIAVRTAYREQKEVDDGRFNNVDLQERSAHVLEYMSLGRLDSEARLRTLRPELFGNQTSLEALQQNLQRLSFEELDVRSKYWSENEGQFVLRQGGVVRDMVPRTERDEVFYILNIIQRAHTIHNVREHLTSYLRNTKILLDYILRTEDLINQWKSNKFSEVSGFVEHLSGLRESLEAASLERLKVQIVDQLARFEMGLVKGVELQITQSQLVYDLAGAHVKPNSPSVEWLRSYLDPSGKRYSRFIE